MQYNPTPAHGSDDHDALKQALLSLLVCDRPGFWTLAELDRVLVPSDEARVAEPPSHVPVEDAVADLYAAGLIHRIGHFVFASRAALAAEQLASF